MSGPVTERDFRMPEFVDADPKDYERRKDGKIVRKDRWERGIFHIASLVGISPRDFEIDDVVAEVETIVNMTAATESRLQSEPWRLDHER